MGDALALTMGVALLGTLISAVLYGITITQTYLYFQRFPRDHYYIKTMVVALWVLDTLHLSLISHSMYYYLLEVSVNGVIGLIVECFFARRLLRLSGGGWSAFCRYKVDTADLIVFTDRLYAIAFFAGLPQLTWITKIGLGSAAGCDMLISVSLCWYLYNARTGYRKTDSLIVTLMLYTFNCGLLTGVCAAMLCCDAQQSSGA
ncbi:hypothetical protein K439DRAFT_1055422 [Ramaria rubella]|nr:hypothetical protein K439DRAFT_1055422 [Ramaria rubella]